MMVLAIPDYVATEVLADQINLTQSAEGETTEIVDGVSVKIGVRKS